MGYVTTLYRRDDLFRQVWEEPMRDVARRYGVSDVALKKTCRKLQVPVPGAGHWNKRSDQRPLPPTLPPLSDGERPEIQVRRWTHGDGTTAPLPAEIVALVNREKAAAVAVPATLETPHALVVSAKRILTRCRTDDRGMQDFGRDDTCLDVEVSKTQLDRALRVMDVLLKAFEARSMRVAITAGRAMPRHQYGRDPAGEWASTRVQVDGAWLQLRLTEKCRTERQPETSPPKGLSGSKLETWTWFNRPRVKYVPNGVLELTAHAGNQQATWRDRAHGPLERRINDVLAQLHVLAYRHHDAQAAAERERQRQADEARRRFEEQHRAAEEKARGERLAAEVDRWRLAHSIRAYVAEAHAIVAAGRCTLIEDGELARNLRWALTYAERIDPLGSLRTEVAGRVSDRAASTPPPTPPTPDR